MVTIKIPSIWRSACQGESVVLVQAGNLFRALQAAVEQYPLLGTYLFIPTGEVNPVLNFFINQEHVRYMGGLQAPVEEGDEIYVVPMITGGSNLEMV
jgi:molybdopterin synthase sulfur carrier subunit